MNSNHTHEVTVTRRFQRPGKPAIRVGECDRCGATVRTDETVGADR